METQSQYQENSLSVVSVVSMGTGVMIDAGIFALTGQVAELAGSYFPLAFLVAAIVTAFSAYSHQNVKCLPVCGRHRHVS